MSTVTNTKIIITQFTELIDTNKKYEKKELVNILNKVYDQVNKKKKEPTPNHNLSRQDLMRKIAELWKQNKHKIDDNNTEIDEKKLDKINDNNKIEEKDLDKNEEKDLDKIEEKDLDKIEEKVPVQKKVKKKK